MDDIANDKAMSGHVFVGDRATMCITVNFPKCFVVYRSFYPYWWCRDNHIISYNTEKSHGNFQRYFDLTKNISKPKRHHIHDLCREIFAHGSRLSYAACHSIYIYIYTYIIFVYPICCSWCISVIYRGVGESYFSTKNNLCYGVYCIIYIMVEWVISVKQTIYVIVEWYILRWVRIHQRETCTDILWFIFSNSIKVPSK